MSAKQSADTASSPLCRMGASVSPSQGTLPEDSWWSKLAVRRMRKTTPCPVTLTKSRCFDESKIDRAYLGGSDVRMRSRSVWTLQRATPHCTARVKVAFHQPGDVRSHSRDVLVT